jgi:integrase
MFGKEGGTPMPKLRNQLPKKCRDRNQCFSWHNGKRIYHGVWGSPKADESYKRFIAALLENPTLRPRDANIGNADVLVTELCDAFLQYHASRLNQSYIVHFKLSIEFLVAIYGCMSVHEITPKKLRTVRDQMVKTGRLCRRTINGHMTQLVRIFSWGCEEELVSPSTAGALKMIKPLPKGEPDTFDHPKRRNVSDEVIRRTLPFLSATVASMVMLQRLLGCRPAEIFNMRVGEIIQNTDSELWYYIPGHHKCERYYSDVDEDKIIPLGKPEQALLIPYLEGKQPDSAVFSPRQAVQEKKVQQRLVRKSKLTPSPREREQISAANPPQYSEFYNKDSYRRAVEYGIEKANKNLSDGETPIPRWTPYSLRHQAATALAKGKDGDKLAQALLDHSSLSTTRRYMHERLEQRKELARQRVNPFAESSGETDSFGA